MNRKLWIIMTGLSLMLLAACGGTTDKSSDPAAAQNLQPNIAGYNVSTAQNITDALSSAGTGAAVLQGNLPVAAAITKAGSVLQCMQNKGAADARIYVENTQTGVIPEVGASIIINTTRVNRNLLDCLITGGGEQQPLTSQSVEIAPCTGSGAFKYKNEDFTYLYVGVGDKLCGFFNQHFESIKANNQG